MTVPTPAEALRLAYDIVKTPCSAAETQRAEVLLGIARELREEQQFRDTRSSLMAFGGIKTDHAHASPPPADTAKLEAFADRFRKQGPGHVGETAVEALDRLMRPAKTLPPEMYRAKRPAPKVVFPEVPTETVSDLGKTQVLPILWKLGDKSQCRHCHTPIEMVEVTITGAPDGVFPPGGSLWRHRYTQQAVCAVPATAGEIEGSEPTHTFAEPVQR